MMYVSDIVIENQDFLKSLVQTNNRKRKTLLLENASRQQLLSIVEICLNLLENNIPINQFHKRKLYKHRDFIRELSQVKSEKKARSLISQQGAGIAISAVLTPVLSNLFEYNNHEL